MKTLWAAIICITLISPALGQTQFPTVDLAVQAIGDNFSIRIGVEAIDEPQLNAPIRLDMGTDVVVALNSLISQKGTYRWTMEDSVYWVRPKAESLSEIPIRTFSINDATRAEVSQALNSLPEVQTWLASHHETRRELINQSTYRDQTRKSLSLSGVSLGTVLNQLIIAFSDQRWAISHQTDTDGKKYVAIYF
jgi:hypothetical protein